MFFYRYIVVESHLNKYSGWLQERYLSGKTCKVATSGKNIHIQKIFDSTAKEWVYFALDVSTRFTPIVSKTPNPAVLGFCSLTKIPRWKALETSMLYVNPEARGKGIASLIYDAVLKDGVMLMSGFSHNQKSRRLWMKLVQNPRYTTWAHDILNLDSYSDITVEDDTFQCDLKVYEDIKKMRRKRRQDIRIIAFNRRYLK